MNLDDERSLLAADKAAHDSKTEFTQHSKDALKAQIALPELIERLNQQTSELLKVADAQKRLAEAAEIYTRRIIRLTWALVALTAALLLFTIILYKDAHTQIQREKLTNDGSIKNQ